MLSVNSSDLHVVLLRDLLESLVVLAEQRQLDVNTRSQTGSEVRRARRDVAEVIAVAELRLLFDLLLGARESLEYLLDVSSLLHRDDSELVCSENTEIEREREMRNILLEHKHVKERERVDTMSSCIENDK